MSGIYFIKKFKLSNATFVVLLSVLGLVLGAILDLSGTCIERAVRDGVPNMWTHFSQDFFWLSSTIVGSLGASFGYFYATNIIRRKKIDALKADIDMMSRHDLKNPLNAIIGLPQIMLVDTNLTQTQRNHLNVIIDSAETMLKMINLSQDLFKLENGTYILNPRPVDMVSLFKSILVQFKRLIQIKHIRIKFSINGKPVKKDTTFIVNSEKLLCHGLFSNLVKNAIEASPDNGTIHFKMSFDDKSKTIELTNGGSVPSVIVKRFFEKYVTKGKDDGTGLGTYMAKIISDVHGWTIKLNTSVPDETTISIKIPNEIKRNDDILSGIINSALTQL